MGPRGAGYRLLTASAAALLTTVTLTYISGGALCCWRLAKDLTDPYAGDPDADPDVALPGSRSATSARSSGA